MNIMPINGTRHQVRGNGEEDCNHFMWLCKDMTKIDDATLRKAPAIRSLVQAKTYRDIRHTLWHTFRKES